MKVVYITNRGGTHPNRRRYFDSVRADYQYVDFKIRWHGLPVSKWRMILSGVICAFMFPQREKYHLFVTSDPQLPAVLMRMFSLLRKDQKIGTYLGSQTLYFIYDNYFSSFTRAFYRFLLSRYDFYICNGPMQAKLLKQIVNVADSKIYININGINADKRANLHANRYNTASHKIVFVGNLYSKWRLYYKGIDLLLRAFIKLSHDHNLQLILIGAFDHTLHSLIEAIVPEKIRHTIEIAGESKEPESFFSNALMYVHCSRGDALPNALLEAMAAGIPAIVSEWTGWSDLVSAVDPKLVCKLDADSLCEAMKYCIDLSEDNKLEHSRRFRELTLQFTEEYAVDTFEKIIKKIGDS